MNTIICFENSDKSVIYNILVIQKIRQLHPDDTLVMISAGDFSASGRKLVPDCRVRAKEYQNAGADFILSLPTASILGGYGKKDFAGAALAQRLNCPALLILPCVPAPDQTLADCEKILRSCAMVMFQEKPDYRKKLSENLKMKMSFQNAQVQAVCDCVPEARELLVPMKSQTADVIDRGDNDDPCKAMYMDKTAEGHSENRFALRLLDAMLQLYYMAKVEFIIAPNNMADENTWVHKTESGKAGAGEERTSENAFEQHAASELSGFLKRYSPEELMNIYGSSVPLVAALYENIDHIQAAESLEQIVKLLSPKVPDPDRLRLFLLRILMGIRSSSMQICSLHVYVPYCHVLAWNPEKGDERMQIESASWVPFVEDMPDPGKGDGHTSDLSGKSLNGANHGLPRELQNYQKLLEADARAAKYSLN